jgi:hypothetical protein
LTTGSLNIDIGNTGVAGENNTIRIGTQGTHTATFVAGINGVDASAGVPVYILSTGQLGTGPSILVSSAPGEKNSKGTNRALARYEEANAKLKTELDKQGRKVQDLEAALADQRKIFEKELADQRRAFEQDLQQQKSKLEAVSQRLDLVAPMEVSTHK